MLRADDRMTRMLRTGLSSWVALVAAGLILSAAASATDVRPSTTLVGLKPTADSVIYSKWRSYPPTAGFPTLYFTCPNSTDDPFLPYPEPPFGGLISIQFQRFQGGWGPENQFYPADWGLFADLATDNRGRCWVEPIANDLKPALYRWRAGNYQSETDWQTYPNWARWYEVGPWNYFRVAWPLEQRPVYRPKRWPDPCGNVGSIFRRVYVTRTNCDVAAKVLRRMSCSNAICDRFRYRGWRCWLTLDINDRTVGKCRKRSRSILWRF
jgi:hypothetical protein